MTNQEQIPIERKITQKELTQKIKEVKWYRFSNIVVRTVLSFKKEQ